MILGADHLALSTADTQQAIQAYQADGFELVFMCRDVSNAVAKKTLLANYQPTHDLAFLRAPDSGLAVEVTNHGPELATGQGPFQYSTGKITLQASHIESEAAFLTTALKFRPQTKANRFKLTSPIPAWKCVLRLEEADVTPCTLDSPGYPCLAIYSNNLVQDLKRCVDSGARDVTESFESEVNGRRLKIAFVRSPGSTIFELIQPL